MTDVKPSMAELRTNTTVASAKASAAGMLSKKDFDDMNDGTVSKKDKAIATGWVKELTDYLDEGTLTKELTRVGLAELPREQARELAQEMLDAAKGLQKAVAAQHGKQNFAVNLLENAKDEYRAPAVRFIKAVQDYFGPESE